jgi:hypothetical protein
MTIEGKPCRALSQSKCVTVSGVKRWLCFCSGFPRSSITRSTRSTNFRRALLLILFGVLDPPLPAVNEFLIVRHGSPEDRHSVRCNRPLAIRPGPSCTDKGLAWNCGSHDDLLVWQLNSTPETVDDRQPNPMEPPIVGGHHETGYPRSESTRPRPDVRWSSSRSARLLA